MPTSCRAVSAGGRPGWLQGTHGPALPHAAPREAGVVGRVEPRGPACEPITSHTEGDSGGRQARGSAEVERKRRVRGGVGGACGPGHILRGLWPAHWASAPRSGRMGTLLTYYPSRRSPTPGPQPAPRNLGKLLPQGHRRGPAAHQPGLSGWATTCSRVSTPSPTDTQGFWLNCTGPAGQRRSASPEALSFHLSF